MTAEIVNTTPTRGWKSSPGARLLHVVGDSAFGGAGKVIRAVAVAGVEHGFRVDVLTTDSRFKAELSGTSVGVIDVPVIMRDIRPLADSHGLLQLQRFLRAARYDIVHTHTSKGGVIGRLAARAAGTSTIVHTMHGFAYHTNTPKPLKIAASAAEAVAGLACDKVVTVARYQETALINSHTVPRRKVICIPNGVEDPYHDKQLTPSTLRADLGVKPDEVLTVTPGRLVDSKGLDTLLGSIVLLGDLPGPRMRFVIVGDGPERARLERLARQHALDDRVVFTGYRPDVPHLLLCADIVALPSWREGLSIAMLEACAAGRAIVATSIPGNREVLDASNSVLVVPQDIRALSNALQGLRLSPIRRRELGFAARARFEGTYSEAAMTAAYLRLYQSLEASHDR